MRKMRNDGPPFFATTGCSTERSCDKGSHPHGILESTWIGLLVVFDSAVDGEKLVSVSRIDLAACSAFSGSVIPAFAFAASSSLAISAAEQPSVSCSVQ